MSEDGPAEAELARLRLDSFGAESQSEDWSVAKLIFLFESRIRRIDGCEIKFPRFCNCFHIISFDIMVVESYKYL